MSTSNIIVDTLYCCLSQPPAGLPPAVEKWSKGLWGIKLTLKGEGTVLFLLDICGAQSRKGPGERVRRQHRRLVAVFTFKDFLHEKTTSVRSTRQATVGDPWKKRGQKEGLFKELLSLGALRACQGNEFSMPLFVDVNPLKEVAIHTSTKARNT
ncbi:hypothetical protein CONPUDRAFT_76348 [Coniophora puteana RWD-64-598 SS2]|uniref:Uncharacterized protein n=1 Tax=Coniophora puteana (strain RWD-64-598) TaxID=741705 RepID=A0A5M3MCY9_CONPW|nr:uncharacterized protein CONPUDRAFT_76348 [Coniophora puteana RWD-64-598 SS2]EIW76754.1 hypothetical protein CONPUDRAFT_76348 [Coniophora puteana RWD-64-598 SS2]